MAKRKYVKPDPRAYEIGVASSAQLIKIQTMADGGTRLTIDLDAEETVLSQRLLAKKIQGLDLITLVFLEHLMPKEGADTLPDNA